MAAPAAGRWKPLYAELADWYVLGRFLALGAWDEQDALFMYFLWGEAHLAGAPANLGAKAGAKALANARTRIAHVPAVLEWNLKLNADVAEWRKAYEAKMAEKGFVVVQLPDVLDEERRVAVMGVAPAAPAPKKKKRRPKKRAGAAGADGHDITLLLCDQLFTEPDPAFMVVAFDLVFTYRTSLAGGALDSLLGPLYAQAREVLRAYEAAGLPPRAGDGGGGGGGGSGGGGGGVDGGGGDEAADTDGDIVAALVTRDGWLADFGRDLTAAWLGYMRTSNFGQCPPEDVLMRALTVRRDFLALGEARVAWHALLDKLLLAGAGEQPNCVTGARQVRYRLFLNEVLAVWWSFLTGAATKSLDPRLAGAEEGVARAAPAAPAPVPLPPPDATVAYRIAGAITRRVGDRLASFLNAPRTTATLAAAVGALHVIAAAGTDAGEDEEEGEEASEREGEEEAPTEDEEPPF